jgi:hypothetical protein
VQAWTGPEPSVSPACQRRRILVSQYLASAQRPKGAPFITHVARAQPAEGRAVAVGRGAGGSGASGSTEPGAEHGAARGARRLPLPRLRWRQLEVAVGRLRVQRRCSERAARAARAQRGCATLRTARCKALCTGPRDAPHDALRVAPALRRESGSRCAPLGSRSARARRRASAAPRRHRPPRARRASSCAPPPPARARPPSSKAVRRRGCLRRGGGLAAGPAKVAACAACAVVACAVMSEGCQSPRPRGRRPR